jgi:hypothetical protein
MNNNLIFIPGTLTVINLSPLLEEDVMIIDEVVDGATASWLEVNGAEIDYIESSDLLSIKQPNGIKTTHRVPQQLADDVPLYWDGDKCYWYEGNSCFYSALYNADEDIAPCGLERSDAAKIYDLLQKMYEFQAAFGLWVFRYLDYDEGVLRTELLNDEQAMFEVNQYIERCEGQCNLSDEFVNEVFSFVGLPFSNSVSSDETKMVLHCLYTLSMTRLK